jgi:hypothetical protein
MAENTASELHRQNHQVPYSLEYFRSLSRRLFDAVEPGKPSSDKARNNLDSHARRAMTRTTLHFRNPTPPWLTASD